MQRPGRTALGRTALATCSSLAQPFKLKVASVEESVYFLQDASTYALLRYACACPRSNTRGYDPRVTLLLRGWL